MEAVASRAFSSSPATFVVAAISRAWRALPQGRLLPDETWRRRHRVIVRLAMLHVPAIIAFGVWNGHSPEHSAGEAAIVGVAAFLADRSSLSRTVRALLASFSLLTASAVLVHLSGGAIEMHFHFFVIVPLLALYQDWIPFLGSIAYVVGQHLVVGLLEPGSVFSHPAGQSNPLLWSLVHGGFIAALSVVSIVSWSMSQRAFTDALTQLASRSLFMDRLADALGRPRPGAAAPIVVFLDLDDFKTVNDSLGHGVGDELLAAVGKRIRQAIRGRDTAARLGGDEFAIMIEQGTPGDGVRLAERILIGLRAPFDVGGHRVSIGASIGVAGANAQTRDADALLREADTAMYVAKVSGSGRPEIFQPSMHQAAIDRLELRAELAGVASRGELRLHYQPIVRLEDQSVSGVEALVRWQHPVRGLLLPAQFLPLAEQTGDIVEIGRWVLLEACRQLSVWHAAHPALAVSVNLSVRQLADPDVHADVAGALATTAMPPDCLILEITESIVMDDIDGAVAALEGLKSLGVRLAIDDFGTGYSSLSYLQRLPVDILKIDHSFVGELVADGKGPTLATLVVTLGRQLGFQTLAEGIEEPGQLAALLMAGCDEGQGFLFAAPLEAGELGALLARWAGRNRGSSAWLAGLETPAVA